MSRYIDADALIERILKLKVVTDDMYGMGIARGIERAETAIQMQPTADVEEVRHGHWESEVKHFFDDYGDLNVYAKGHCSECGKDYPFNPTIAREYICRPENLIGYEPWDIDVEPIKERVSQKARTNKNLLPFCPNCGARMDRERSKNGTNRDN